MLGDFIRNTPDLFGNNVQISNPQLQIVNNALELSGSITARGRQVELQNVRLIVDNGGQIALESRDGMDLSTLNRAEQGYVNLRIRTLGRRLNRELDAKIPQQWRVLGYQIVGDKIRIRTGRGNLAQAA